MQHSRLENLLRRNRRNAVTDLILGAVFLAVMVFAGLQVGRALPKLSTARPSAPVTGQIATAHADGAAAPVPNPSAASRPFFPAAA